MDIKDFIAGEYKKGYKYEYFVPEKINHTFYWTDPSINTLLEKATLKIGELNQLSRLMPEISIFIKMHTMKEAVVSSRIEGIRTNISEAFYTEREIAPEKRDDWKEVNNYVTALENAMEQLSTLPISSRMILKIHEVLLSSVRGEHKNPGEYRRSQNWIGGSSLEDAVFIPPAHIELPWLMSDLEEFINNDFLNIPHLIKAALIHYQFETIHPFLDGNGRLGRLLISLYLTANNILDKPLLYISDYFEKNKALYYDNLTFVREKNDLGQWFKFFLVGVLQTAEDSIRSLQAIVALKRDIETKRIPAMGKRSKNAIKLLHLLFHKPIVNTNDVKDGLSITMAAANALLQSFIEHNILVQIGNDKRNRLYLFKEYMMVYGHVIDRMQKNENTKTQ